MRDVRRIAEVLRSCQLIASIEGYPITANACSEIIAEIEKPGDDDAKDVAERILNDCDGTRDTLSLCANYLQQYAESYHAKKCAEVLSSAADRAMAVYARDCDGCSPRLSDDCDEQCPYIAKIRRAIMEAPRA